MTWLRWRCSYQPGYMRSLYTERFLTRRGAERFRRFIVRRGACGVRVWKADT